MPWNVPRRHFRPENRYLSGQFDCVHRIRTLDAKQVYGLPPYDHWTERMPLLSEPLHVPVGLDQPDQARLQTRRRVNWQSIPLQR